MTVSELYKILEVLVKENPQADVYFMDDFRECELVTEVEMTVSGDLVLL